MVFPIIVLVAIATTLAFVSAARRRRAKNADVTLELGGADADDLPEVRSCPVCLHEYAPRNVFCVIDGAELIDGPPSSALPPGAICPTCRRGFPPGANFCPDDADELVPVGFHVATAGPLTPPVGKICPHCGDRHATLHTFCGKDGSRLVTVN